MNKRQIKKALDVLAERDTHLCAALKRVGYPEPRLSPKGFEAFLTAIISQQISIRAAATIKQRVVDALGEVTPEVLLSLPIETLRCAGMSYRKVEYARGLAEAIVSGEFSPDALEDMDDQEAIKQITQLRGFGVWSAEVYLMFSMGRPDIFPADDLIIRQSLEKMKRKRKKLTAKPARELVKHWAPYRSVGSLFLWHLHHVDKN